MDTVQLFEDATAEAINQDEIISLQGIWHYILVHCETAWTEKSDDGKVESLYVEDTLVMTRQDVPFCYHVANFHANVYAQQIGILEVA